VSLRTVCGIIPPRRKNILGDRSDGYFGDCILPVHHSSLFPHVLKTPEGEYFSWEDDPDCDCCEPEDDDHCYLFGEISEAEYQQILVDLSKKV
jgi:hypothetical protein